MKIHRQSADDDQLPTLADVREFAERLQLDREDAARRPSFDDDTWRWFLSLFKDGSDDGESDKRSVRRAA